MDLKLFINKSVFNIHTNHFSTSSSTNSQIQNSKIEICFHTDAIIQLPRQNNFGFTSPPYSFIYLSIGDKYKL